MHSYVFVVQEIKEFPHPKNLSSQI